MLEVKMKIEEAEKVSKLLRDYYDYKAAQEKMERVDFMQFYESGSYPETYRIKIPAMPAYEAKQVLKDYYKKRRYDTLKEIHSIKIT